LCERRKIKEGMRLNFVTILRNFLGLVFVFSGFVKLVDLVWFSGIVSSYGVLPDFLILPFSFLVSFFEFIFGLMLLFGIGVVYALFGLILMVFVFTIFVFSRYVLGEVGDCGCFGRLVGGRNDLFHLFLNLALISGLIFVKLKTKGGR